MQRRELLKAAAAGAGLIVGHRVATGRAAAQESAGAVTDYEVFGLGDFELMSGEVLRSAKLAYKTHGELNADKSNVIVYPTWYSGRHTDNEAMIGESHALDPSRYFIVVANQFGNGLSSSPSNSPAPQDRARFPLITPYDNVRAQMRLLEEHYGVERIAPICGSARTAVHNYVFLEGLKAALTADCAWRGGDYTSPPVAGIRAFSRVYTGWFASQSFFREGLHSVFGGDDVEGIFAMAEQSFGSFDANDLLAMVATWQSADISALPRFGGDLSAALAAIRSRAFVMPSRTDLYFPPEDNEIEVARMPDAELRVIPSIWGHMAGGGGNPADAAWLDTQLRELLAS